MLDHLLEWISDRRPGRLVNEGYMERYYLFRLGGVTFFLHRFLGDDPDRGWHDHPWGWSVSLILTGGYIEQRPRNIWGGHIDDCRVRFYHRRPGRLNFIRGTTFHRILLFRDERVVIEKYTCPGCPPLFDRETIVALRPCWTLFAHGGRAKGWGFVRPSQRLATNGLPTFRPYKTGPVIHLARWYREKDCPKGRDLKKESRKPGLAGVPEQSGRRAA